MAWKFRQKEQRHLLDAFPPLPDVASGERITAPDTLEDTVQPVFDMVGTRELSGTQLLEVAAAAGVAGVFIGPVPIGRIWVIVGWNALHDDPATRQMEWRMYDPTVTQFYPMREFHSAGGNRVFGGPAPFYLPPGWRLGVILDAIAALQVLNASIAYVDISVGDKIPLLTPHSPGVETST